MRKSNIYVQAFMRIMGPLRISLELVTRPRKFQIHNFTYIIYYKEAPKYHKS